MVGVASLFAQNVDIMQSIRTFIEWLVFFNDNIKHLTKDKRGRAFGDEFVPNIARVTPAHDQNACVRNWCLFYSFPLDFAQHSTWISVLINYRDERVSKNTRRNSQAIPSGRAFVFWVSSKRPTGCTYNIYISVYVVYHVRRCPVDIMQPIRTYVELLIYHNITHLIKLL